MLNQIMKSRLFQSLGLLYFRIVIITPLIGLIFGLIYFFFAWKTGMQKSDGAIQGFLIFSGIGVVISLTIGTSWFKAGLKAYLSTALFGFLIFMTYPFPKLMFLKEKMIWSYSIGFLIYVALLAIKRSSLFQKRKIEINKSIEQIDAMGNGDTYLKGKLFEEYVCEVYKALGFQAWTTGELRKMGRLPGGIQSRGGSGEQGVDVLAFDPVEKNYIAIQCKHYSSKVSNKAVQEITAAMPLYKAQKAVVITNQYFTQSAIELARENKVSLIDRDNLPKLIHNAVISSNRSN